MTELEARILREFEEKFVSGNMDAYSFITVSPSAVKQFLSYAIREAEKSAVERFDSEVIKTVSIEEGGSICQLSLANWKKRKEALEKFGITAS